MPICSKCNNEKEIYNKKRNLCAKCYRIWYASQPAKNNGNNVGKETPINADIIENEMKFIINFFKHTNWTRYPATFRISDDNYTPDFYDGERNAFIEVAGTRQAYHANKHKYEKFRRIYPKILFEIRKVNGSLLDEETDTIDWNTTFTHPKEETPNV